MKKLEIIGNYLILTDTETEIKEIESPIDEVYFRESDGIFRFWHRSSHKNNEWRVGSHGGYKLDSLLDADGNPFADIEALLDLLRNLSESSVESEILETLVSKPESTEILICVKTGGAVNFVDEQLVRYIAPLEADTNTHGNNEIYLKYFKYDGVLHNLILSTANYDQEKEETILFKDFNDGFVDPIVFFQNFYDLFFQKTGLTLPDISTWEYIPETSSFSSIVPRFVIPYNLAGTHTADVSLLGDISGGYYNFDNRTSGQKFFAIAHTTRTYTSIGNLKKDTGSLVKQFNELGEEIIANRKFYNEGVLISEPNNWQEGSCVSEEQVSPKAITQKTILLDSSNPSITFLASTLTYIDIGVLEETGTLEIIDGTNVVIPMSSDKIYKYDRNFDSYTDKVNPFDIKVDFTGTTGSILIEVGLI